jgi:hypothetical protein
MPADEAGPPAWLRWYTDLRTRFTSYPEALTALAARQDQVDARLAELVGSDPPAPLAERMDALMEVNVHTVTRRLYEAKAAGDRDEIAHVEEHRAELVAAIEAIARAIERDDPVAINRALNDAASAVLQAAHNEPPPWERPPPREQPQGDDRRRRRRPGGQS